MNLIPKAVIAGMMQGQFVSTGPVNTLVQLPGGPSITPDIINRIWSQVQKEYPYQSLQFEPSGKGAVFLSGPEDLVLIQPPLLQVRSPVEAMGVTAVAEKVQFVLSQIVHQVPSPPGLNLGVKLVYHAPAPGNDAVSFARTELVKGEDDLQTLAGGTNFLASIKVVMLGIDVNRTLLVEPLVADPTNMYLDLDSQYPGVVDPNQIRDRISQADDFMAHQVKAFLEARAQGWGAGT